MNASHKNQEFQRCKYIILNFCKDVSKINWGKEVKIAKKLLKMYPNFEHWVGMSMGEKPTSLSFFLTSEGKNFLSLIEKKQQLDLPEKKEYSIEDNKLGEDTQTPKRLKTLRDFLKSDS